MKKNTVKEKLLAGEPSVGTWLSLCAPIAAEHMAHTGWDWVVVDTEHSPVTLETAVSCFQAISATNCIPMARVAGNDPMLIKRLLDAGAMGIVIPMVNSSAEAARAVDACRFPPLGHRSLGGGRAALYWDDYFATANREILIVVQIEHIDAVRCAREILAVEGVDACFIGPNDLAGSMGITPTMSPIHPDHVAAIMEVLAAAKDVGKPAGIHCPDAEHVVARIQQGFQFIACASDLRLLVGAARDTLSGICAAHIGNPE